MGRSSIGCARAPAVPLGIGAKHSDSSAPLSSAEDDVREKPAGERETAVASQSHAIANSNFATTDSDIAFTHNHFAVSESGIIRTVSKVADSSGDVAVPSNPFAASDSVVTMASRRPRRHRLGEALRNARFAVRLTASELAARSGFSRHAVSQWENEHQTPTAVNKARLVATLASFDAGIARALAQKLEIAFEPATRPPTSAERERALQHLLFLAAEAGDVSPRVARRVLAAALEEMRAQSLTVDALATVLAPPPTKS
jgi:transcriptional regulator with XRE-family HTH domain